MEGMNQEPVSLTPLERRLRTLFVLAVFTLLSVFILGLLYAAASPSVQLEDGVPRFVSEPTVLVVLTLAYVAGISMIVLPCTLPALFVVVPLSMGRGVRKGFVVAVLFGAGLTTTLTVYGVFVAALGKIFYLDQITLLMWFVAGVAAYVFGLSELSLLRLRWPSVGLGSSTIAKGGDYFKSYSLGLLLGNAGIGCPNPAFYLLLTYIASTASIGFGGILGATHGVGRAVPLLFFSMLAILGVNATSSVVRNQARVRSWVGWGLVGFATLILPKPLFGHAWWELSIIHGFWNMAVRRTLGVLVAESDKIETMLGDFNVHDPGVIYGPWLLFAMLWSIPIFWKDYNLRKAGWKTVAKLLAIFGSTLVLAYTGETMPHTH